jgi:hypothetical protein
MEPWKGTPHQKKNRIFCVLSDLSEVFFWLEIEGMKDHEWRFFGILEHCIAWSFQENDTPLCIFGSAHTMIIE